MEKLVLNSLVEGREDAGCLPLAEIRRNTLKQRRSLAFLSFVVEDVLTPDMEAFLRVGKDVARDVGRNVDSMTRKRKNLLQILETRCPPIVATTFWPDSKDASSSTKLPSNFAAAFSQTASSSSSSSTTNDLVVLSPLIREFGRHLGTCISTCIRRTIDPEANTRNMEALKLVLRLVSLVGEYVRFRDWSDNRAAGKG